ncbi:MMPL family transporter [Jiangella asiatica]|uniref:MMPL family transporter n=1 Tax=Jiangella asiatica TaxID=2530372 RepID=A0A4R5DIY9_9ACTN|nr:MMPL family transporter [Jiangella asiatica]TDE14092.1 MMPL family transporter [Jiangella asiatica]
MATLLYRLGRFSFRRRGLVALIWVVLLGAFGAGAATLSGQTSDSFTIPGTESQEALDVLAERFPEAAADGAQGRVVFAAPDGQTLTDPANQQAVESVVAELADAPQVATVADPFQSQAVSPDGTVAYAQVNYDVMFGDLTDEAKDALDDAVQAGRDAGLTVEVGGDVVEEVPATSATELIGVAVAALVLVITFGSFVAAGLPLLTAVLGVGIGVAGITALTGFIDMGSTTPILAMMLGLAVAIDYALFIVSRYRHELALGREGEEAAGRALGTAGSAVVFAGLTVVIALAGLSVVGVPMLTEMGLAAAATVLVAVLIALTLLPALLGFAGRRVLAGRVPGLKARDPESDEGRPGLGQRWARLVTRRPIPVLLVAVVGMLAVAIPALDLRLGLPDQGSAGTETTQRKAYDLLADGFGPGFNGPLLVVVDTSESADPQRAAEQVAGVVGRLDDVAAVVPPALDPDRDTALMTVIPQGSPSSAATEDLVGAIRDTASDIEADAGAAVMVTGTTAITIDFSETMNDALVPYLALVVGLSFVLLTMVFRSLLVPLKAALGFLLSMMATFGVTVAVFQNGFLADLIGVEQTGPIISMLPIFLIGVVFGLAMDYEVFLVTRMREEFVHGAAPRQSIVTGFQHGGRVVAAAAVIMISVFAGFIFAHDEMIKQMGFALAIAVAFDAFVVRMTIVPAVMALLGRRAWWLPRWLDRVLPDVDVEGERLTRRLARDTAVEEPVHVP